MYTVYTQTKRNFNSVYMGIYNGGVVSVVLPMYICIVCMNTRDAERSDNNGNGNVNYGQTYMHISI